MTAHLNQVHLIEPLVVAGPLDIQNRDNILMVEVAQQLHLSQCPQTEHRVVEWGDLLDRNLLPGRLVNGGARSRCQLRLSSMSDRGLPDYTVCTLPNDILNLILIGDVEGDLARSSLWRVLLGHGVSCAGLEEKVNIGNPRREPNKSARQAGHSKGTVFHGAETRIESRST